MPKQKKSSFPFWRRNDDDVDRWLTQFTFIHTIKLVEIRFFFFFFLFLLPSFSSSTSYSSFSFSLHSPIHLLYFFLFLFPPTTLTSWTFHDIYLFIFFYTSTRYSTVTFIQFHWTNATTGSSSFIKMQRCWKSNAANNLDFRWFSTT